MANVNKKQTLINLLAQLAVFGLQLFISIYITPVMLWRLGNEAYGFLGLINNVVNYSSIFTVALNSMAGRYITISYHRGDQKEVSEYFSSVFYANCIMAAILFAIGAVTTVFVERMINVPAHMIWDLKVATLLTFASTCITLVNSVFGVSAFVKNKIHLNAIAQMLSTIVRVLLLYTLFFILFPKMWYYCLAAVISAITLTAMQYCLTRRLTPNLQIKRSHFRLSRVWEIMKMGTWVSIENINKLLQTGLDLLVANLFVGTNAMGLLSIAKNIPNIVLQMSGQVSSVFYPECARCYAENRHADLIYQFKSALRFMAAFMSVPAVGFMAFGKSFYRLWLPMQTPSGIEQIYLLSVITILPILASSWVEALFYANTLTGKIKGSVIITSVFSVAGFIIELLLLYLTNGDRLVIIAAVSSVCMIVRYVIVTPVYAAHALQINLWSFFPTVLRSAGTCVALYVFFYLINSIATIDSWMRMAMICAASGAAGYLLVFTLLLSKKEKKRLVAMAAGIGRKAK